MNSGDFLLFSGPCPGTEMRPIPSTAVRVGYLHRIADKAFQRGGLVLGFIGYSWPRDGILTCP